MNQLILLFLCGVLALSISEPSVPPAFAADKDKPDKAAIKRARKTVRILDDVYKTAIVLITDKYVNDE